MNGKPSLLLIAGVALLLSGGTAEARVSLGVSGLLAIDTVTAVNDEANAPPPATTLAAIYPNPFNPRAVIGFDLAETGPLELAIYDLSGRLVRVIDSGTRSAGRYQAHWNGQDDAGQAVPSGIYFCRLKSELGSQTRKLTLAR